MDELDTARDLSRGWISAYDRAGPPAPCFQRSFGVWRSPVARLLWERDFSVDGRQVTAKMLDTESARLGEIEIPASLSYW